MQQKMITVRLSEQDYEKVEREAQLKGVSMNLHCLQKLGIAPETGKVFQEIEKGAE